MHLIGDQMPIYAKTARSEYIPYRNILIDNSEHNITITQTHTNKNNQDRNVSKLVVLCLYNVPLRVSKDGPYSKIKSTK